MTSKQPFSGKKIAIFGGAGFIGSNLAEEFLNLGSEVTVIDGFVEHTGANTKNIEKISSKIKLYRSDVGEIDNLREIVLESDLIIDSMALTAHNIGMKDPLLDVKSNLIAHIHLIQALEGMKRKKIIYLGSTSQYGKTGDKMIKEDEPQAPIDSQGINKSAAEQFYAIYSKIYCFDAVSLRIPNCFGNNQRTEGADIGLIGLFIRDLLKDKTVEIFGSDSRKKSLIYVKDLVNQIIGISTQEFSGFEAYNIDGSEITIKEILEDMIYIIGKGKYTVKPFPEHIKKIDQGEPKYSSDKIKSKLGNIEKTEFKTAIKNTIEHFKRNQVV